MADTTTPEPTEDAPATGTPEQDPGITADALAEIKAALRKANKEAETSRLRLKELEDADKSEADKQTEALATVTAERDEAVIELARLRAAVKYEIAAEDLDLLGSGTAEEIESRAKRLAARDAAAGKPRRPAPDPSQGRGGASGSTTADQFAAAIQGSFTT